jgi:hypothetical protein
MIFGRVAGEGAVEPRRKEVAAKGASGTGFTKGESYTKGEKSL